MKPRNLHFNKISEVFIQSLQEKENINLEWGSYKETCDAGLESKELAWTQDLLKKTLPNPTTVFFTAQKQRMIMFKCKM